MPTDPVPAFPPPSRPTGATADLRRQVWVFVMFLSWGSFSLGRWIEAAEPWRFGPAFSGSIGAFMLMAAIFGLRDALRKIGTSPGT